MTPSLFASKGHNCLAPMIGVRTWICLGSSSPILERFIAFFSKAKFIVASHSLGSALAVLLSVILFFHKEFFLERMQRVYTFGQPRVGDDAFKDYMGKNLR
ncbi:hypothetical protein V6N13_054805 [Hibiscus sabdariffa]|uniref:Fungal lipase-type domain-containing protein n=1 Tax=Hibiscus sabdariffa TaxID=183260 RepID=A0ABR2DWN5_9ROSI